MLPFVFYFGQILPIPLGHIALLVLTILAFFNINMLKVCFPQLFITFIGGINYLSKILIGGSK